MIPYHVTDWDDAYANMPHIPESSQFPVRWSEAAAAFRKIHIREGSARLDQRYGELARQEFDLFLPQGTPRGLVIFIHCGYWKAYDKNYWSHLANGSVSNGYAIALPSYRLCPDVQISDIVSDVALAVTTIAGLIDGPIHLAGHSAGGHLCTRLVAQPSPLPANVANRIKSCLSISGIHDLRPLMRTKMNEILRIDQREAEIESPALLAPQVNTRLICWVGSAERMELIRQSALLANIWSGLGAATVNHMEPNRHHLNVVDGLCDPTHPLTRALIG